MPGRNCCMPQCTVSETQKHVGIKLFQIPTRKTFTPSGGKRPLMLLENIESLMVFFKHESKMDMHLSVKNIMQKMISSLQVGTLSLLTK